MWKEREFKKKRVVVTMMVVGVLRRLLVIKAQESFDVEQALQKVDSFL